jgi:putative ABC transport system permease protein
MPPEFESTPVADVWTTIGQVSESIGSGDNYQVVARLKDGVSAAQVNAYFSTLVAPYVQAFGAPKKGKPMPSFLVKPLNDLATGDVRTPLFVLFAATSFILLIACANVANLQIARGQARTRDIALRIALGASRWRVFRQLLAENLVLSGMALLPSLGVAWVGLRALLTLVPPNLPRTKEIAFDGSLVAFAGLLALLLGGLVGLASASLLSRTSMGDALKTGEGVWRSGRTRLGGALVVAEVALSLVLLVESGFLIGSFAKLTRTDPGFEPRGLVAVQVWTSGVGRRSQEELAGFYPRAVDGLRAIPGVMDVGIIGAGGPLEQGGNDFVRIAGDESNGVSVDYREVTSDYFRTLGVKLLRGRLFEATDTAGSDKVAIINGAFAHARFGDADPVGRWLLSGRDRLLIVGVVSDVRSQLHQPVPSTLFIPAAQASYGTHSFFEAFFPTVVLIRTHNSPATLETAVKDALWRLEPDLPIGSVRPMERVLSGSIANQRLLTSLVTGLAAVALVLATVGLYGVMSFLVGRRTREIGIRMAVGATDVQIVRQIVREGLAFAVSGLAIGLVGVWVATRTLRSTVFAFESGHWTIPLAASALLVVVLALASFGPARRAARLEIVDAFRQE